MDISVIIPQILKINGSTAIQQLIEETNNEILSDKSIVEFDFTNTRFIAGEMTVLLGMLLKEIQRSNKTYKLNNMPDNISNALTRNNFLPYFQGGMALSDIYNNTIQFYCGDARDDNKLNEYLNKQVFGNTHWFDVTSGQQEKENISSAIHELAINVHEHSTVNEVLCCGQYYPNIHRLSFSLADNGISIPTSVHKHYPTIYNTDSGLINWATQRGNSVKASPASGLGLFSVKDKLTSSGGLTIISRYGYWQKSPDYVNEPLTFDLSESPLKGTFIHFSIDMNDNINIEENQDILKSIIF